MLNEKEVYAYLDQAVTICGGRLNQQQLKTFDTIVKYLMNGQYYIITGGLKKKDSCMYKPIEIDDSKVLTIYSADDGNTDPDLIVFPREMSFIAKNFADQAYLMVQSLAGIYFDGGYSTYYEIISHINFWKRYPEMISKHPLFFFSDRWDKMKSCLFANGVINKDIDQAMIYCRNVDDFIEKFEGIYKKI